MTKVQIGSLLEFVPDVAGAREAKLLDLVEEHMGKDMRAVLREYLDAPAEVDRLELLCGQLEEQLDEARERINGLEDALEEERWNRS